jgi:uncharacterized protein YggE
MRGAGGSIAPAAARGFTAVLPRRGAGARSLERMSKLMFGLFGVLSLSACQGQACPRDTVVQVLPADVGDPRGVAVAGPTITVGGDAEILTAPDRFVISIGFDLQATTLDAARDGSQARAAALLGVVAERGIEACDVQTEQLSLQPRYDGYSTPGGHTLIGYQASRSLTITLHRIEDVEPLLYAMLAAGANRVDRVHFESSQSLAKRSEARVLAVQAARAKAEAMAAALGQTVGDPLRVEEGAAAQPWQTPTTNYVLNNDTAPALSDTVASGKIRVHAGVSVVFALRPA